MGSTASTITFGEKQYLDQYLREFDFRYNVRQMNDQDRTTVAIKKTAGKRLTLKQPKDADQAGIFSRNILC